MASASTKTVSALVSVAVGGLNGDGHPDLVVAGPDGIEVPSPNGTGSVDLLARERKGRFRRTGQPGRGPPPGRDRGPRRSRSRGKGYARLALAGPELDAARPRLASRRAERAVSARTWSTKARSPAGIRRRSG